MKVCMSALPELRSDRLEECGAAKTSPDQKIKSAPSFSGLFEAFEKRASKSMLKMAVQLGDVVQLSASSNYKADYRSNLTSESFVLQWHNSQSRYIPEGTELSIEGEPSMPFKNDIMRGDYSFTSHSRDDEGIYTTPLKQETSEQRIECLKSKVILTDFLRITEIAHQGHLAATAEGAYSCNKDVDRHLFVQSGTPQHQIILNEDGSATVQSSTRYSVRNTGTEQLISGLSLDATVITRIGVSKGGLNHRALGVEETCVSYELAYKKDREPVAMMRGLLAHVRSFV